MSFGYSIGDLVLLTKLAWKTVQNARKACGEHGELTREALSLHVVLRRLEQEAVDPGSPFNRHGPHHTRKEELKLMVDGCGQVLSELDHVLMKYNALSKQEKSGRKLLQKITFGNGKMADLRGLRDKLTYHTSVMNFLVTLISSGTVGRVEQQMNDAGRDLRKIKVNLNGIAAQLMSRNSRHEGSVLTAYADDDRAFWKEFRRDLIQMGCPSSLIKKHKSVIIDYMKELCGRGLFDDKDPNDDAEKQYCDVHKVVEGAMAHDPETRSKSKASQIPKAEVELQVESHSPLDFYTEPNSALHLQTLSGHEEGPSDDLVFRIGADTQIKPETELCRIYLSNEISDKSQQCPIEEIRAPKLEAKPNTATADSDHDRSDSAGQTPRNGFPSYVEGDGSDAEIDKEYHCSEQILPKQRTGDAWKGNKEEPSTKSGKRNARDSYDEVELKEALPRDLICESREAAFGQELPLNISKPESSDYHELGAGKPVILDHALAPPPPALTKNAAKSEKQDEETTRLFHDRWHDHHDKIAPRCMEWVSRSVRGRSAATLIYDIDETRKQVNALKPRADLVTLQLDLLYDMDDMRRVILEHQASPEHTWSDRRSKGKGYRVVVYTYETWSRHYSAVSWTGD
ncbi:MAG: hypothetical protein Q9175_005002, partial [Cornicularia normoerica]